MMSAGPVAGDPVADPEDLKVKDQVTTANREPTVSRTTIAPKAARAGNDPPKDVPMVAGRVVAGVPMVAGRTDVALDVPTVGGPKVAPLVVLAAANDRMVDPTDGRAAVSDRMVDPTEGRVAVNDRMVDPTAGRAAVSDPTEDVLADSDQADSVPTADVQAVSAPTVVAPMADDPKEDALTVDPTDRGVVPPAANNAAVEQAEQPLARAARRNSFAESWKLAHRASASCEIPIATSESSRPTFTSANT